MYFTPGGGRSFWWREIRRETLLFKFASRIYFWRRDVSGLYFTPGGGRSFWWRAIRYETLLFKFDLRIFSTLRSNCPWALYVVDQNVLSYHLTAVENSGDGRQV